MTKDNPTPPAQHVFPENRFDEGCIKCGGFEGEPCEPPTGNGKNMTAIEIAKTVLELYEYGNTVWLSDRENISKENCIKMARAIVDMNNKFAE